MPTDKVAVSVLEDFVKKVRIAAKSNQKTVNIPTDEALSVVFNLNLILLNLLDKNQEEKAEENTTVTVVMDGGGFEEKR